MEIRTLRYFLAVAREGSITRAANYLHLTQPTLSRQIQDLEDSLGHPLLIRRSHRVDLTPEGMLLRKRAEEIVAMVDKTEAEFTAMEDTVSGDVYIGGGESQAIRLIAGVIDGLRAEYPGIRFHLHSGNAQDVTDRLDKGLLDFGILIQPANIDKYDCLDLPAQDVWGVALPKTHPLAAKPSLEKQDLLGLPLLLSSQAISPQPGGTPFWSGSGRILTSWRWPPPTTCSTTPRSWWRRGWAAPSPWKGWPIPPVKATCAFGPCSRGLPQG